MRKEGSGSDSPPSKCCAENKVILLAIQSQLTGFDTRLSILEAVHEEIRSLRHSLEFSQEQIHSQTRKQFTHDICTITH